MRDGVIRLPVKEFVSVGETRERRSKNNASQPAHGSPFFACSHTRVHPHIFSIRVRNSTFLPTIRSQFKNLFQHTERSPSPFHHVTTNELSYSHTMQNLFCPQS